jgi:AraC family transcriptional regulator of adaptative response / DNA-3-methyladenine glycosylase II
MSVRAILGQQVSVKGASTLAGRVAEKFGAGYETARLFPPAGVLAEADLTTVGVTGQRARTIQDLARRVADGAGLFDASLDLDAFERNITLIPGIGPWTAQYIAMRLGEPDAFPAGDLHLRRSGLDAEAWRPWRAYAAFHIWRNSQ